MAVYCFVHLRNRTNARYSSCVQYVISNNMIPITLYTLNYFGGQAGQVDNQKKLNCITLFILYNIEHRYIPHKYDALR